MTEIEKLLSFDYEECVSELMKKYGPCKKDYFANENCKSANASIKRTNEGLYIHHIDEDKAIMLSSPEYAKKNPFAFQKANRLVYCNLLEHLVLHIKIFEYPSKNKNENELVGQGGISNFIVPKLNDIYSGFKTNGWEKVAAEKVLPLKSDYLMCIKKLVKLNYKFKLISSFNEQFGLWSINNNFFIFEEMQKIGVSKENL